jgi:hypothetical protein
MPMVTVPFPLAEPEDVRDHRVDFAPVLGVGNDLTTATWAITVRSTLPGFAPDPTPDQRLVGTPTNAGTVSTQRVAFLMPGNDYVLSILGTGTDGQATTLWGTLRCRDTGSPVIKEPGQQVGFDYLEWLQTYPEFEAISEANAYGYWREATLYLANDGTGPVTDDASQSRLLNLLTAHIAARYAAGQALAGSPIVGAITSASEGSVSVSGQALVASGTQAWYLTTKYGADFWAATAPYRTMRYRVAAPRIFDPLWRRSSIRGW